jgi:hypothetical protein
LTVEPFPADPPPLGSCPITVFAGWSFSTYVVLTLN